MGENRKRKKASHGNSPKSELVKRHSEYIENAKILAQNRFEIDPLPIGIPEDFETPESHSFEWKNNPVPLKTEQKLAKLVVRKGEFGWLDDQRVDEIGKLVKDLDMTLDQALSLRSALLQQKTVYSHGRLQAKGKMMLKLYKEGLGIVQLSRRFDFPPMNIFRVILKEMGWSKARIKDMLRTPSKFKPRERTEFEEAESADILADWFESQGVRVRKQSEMVKEQMLEHGRPVNTPDLLFLDHVTINGEPIAWIDAKHFYGADVDFQRKKIAKQATRYVDAWGQGALVFRHGFCNNLLIPGAVLLDSGPLDLTELISLTE